MCANSIQDELELYHFHFNSSQFAEDFKDLTENTIRSTARNLEEMLLSKFPGNKDAIHTQINNLIKLFVEKAEEPLQKVRETAREIFKLPPNVVLPGYGGEKLIPPRQFKILEKEVSDLEKEHIKEIYYREFLKRELRSFEYIKPLHEEVKEKLKFYKQNRPKVGEKSIEELGDVLKSCEEFYSSKRAKSKKGVCEEFEIFQTQ